jgi:hypothetical protein
MNALSCSRIVALASAVVLGIASASARADIFAATCAPQGGGDIAIVHATLGTRVALPASVNTDIESHPSITSDGQRLVFTRRVGFTNARFELWVIDFGTGRSTTIFTRSASEFSEEFSENPFFGSSIRPQGSFVITGRNFSSTFAAVWSSSLSAGFSNITSTLLVPNFDFRAGGRVIGVAVATLPLWIAMHVKASDRDQLLLFQRSVGTSSALSDSRYEYSQPAMAANDPQSVVFRQRRISIRDGHKVFSPGEIQSRPATLAGFAGTPTTLPFSGTAHDESQPAVTADGRYIAFVRFFVANDRLFVWDTQTQTLLNSNGVDLGQPGTAVRCGSLSLYTRPVFATSAISTSSFSQVGNVNVTLVQASSIGIFVQRIVGKTEVLGRKAYELETVGRFPLGSYGAGNVFTHWDFEVDGEALAPGKYLVTVRAVEGDVVRELGEPQVLKIDKQGRAHMLGKDPR